MTTLDIPDTLAFRAAWTEGAAAARAGKQITDCPHADLSVLSVGWKNGHAITAHLIAKEDDEL